MAQIGMKTLKYALLGTNETTYTTLPKTMGAAISASVTPNFAEASLYADDRLQEYVQAFQSATVSLGVDNDDDVVFAELLGKTIDTASGIVSSNINDNPPYVGFGYIVTKIKNNVPRFRVQFFPKIKFSPFIPDATTKGETIEFGTVTVEGTTVANVLGVWESHLEVATESEAIAALDEFFVQET